MKELTIQGVVFYAPEPYESGHVLLANEAGALNQTYLENLRNNFAKTVESAKNADGEITESAMETLVDEFDEYVAGYTFGVKRHGETDPVRLVKAKVKAGKLTEAQKRAIAEEMGLEFTPKA